MLVLAWRLLAGQTSAVRATSWPETWDGFRAILANRLIVITCLA